MYAEKLQLGYPTRLEVWINASHIHVYKKGEDKPVFRRVPENDNWYDKNHQCIVEALNNLEKAITTACQVEFYSEHVHCHAACCKVC